MDPRLCGNLVLSMMMVNQAILEAMPILFPEVADDMVKFQIDALLDEMWLVREDNSKGERQCT